MRPRIRGSRAVVNSKDLLRKARASEDGEAYVTVARGAGVRVGVGARAKAPPGRAAFVEVILDPFPERPRVTPGRLARQARVMDRLETRGYVVACEQDGTIVCERRTAAQGLEEELRVVRRLLGLRPEGASGP